MTRSFVSIEKGIFLLRVEHPTILAMPKKHKPTTKQKPTTKPKPSTWLWNLRRRKVFFYTMESQRSSRPAFWSKRAQFWEVVPEIGINGAL